MAPVVGESVEWLPIEAERQPYWVFNPLIIADCLDHQQTETRPNLPWSIVKYVFDESLLPESSVFRIPEKRHASTFTYSKEGLTDQFKTVYERTNLTGLRFKQLWTNTDRPK